MKNCPNCGAPYALDSPVCAYCGTVREGEGWGDDFESREVIKTITGQTHYLPPKGYAHDGPKDTLRDMELIDPLSGARDLNGNLYQRYQRAGKKPFNPDATIYAGYTHPNGDVEWGYAKFDSKSGVIHYPFEKTVKVDKAITVNLQEAAQAQFDAAQWRQTVQIEKQMQAVWQALQNDITRRSQQSQTVAFILFAVTVAMAIITRVVLTLI